MSFESYFLGGVNFSNRQLRHSGRLQIL